jgi:hypothetical protein
MARSRNMATPMGLTQRSNLAPEAVSGAFVSLLRQEWPAWSGGGLPAELGLGRETLAPTPFVGRCITATITRSPSHVLVRLHALRDQGDSVVPQVVAPLVSGRRRTWRPATSIRAAR